MVFVVALKTNVLRRLLIASKYNWVYNKVENLHNKDGE